ncbi:MAG: hypothetical protein ACHQQQ_14295 [Bacteroidota bacterium]
MYTYLFAYFYKMAVKGKNTFPRYTAALFVGFTILTEIFLIATLVKVYIGIDLIFSLSKPGVVILLILLVVITYLYYNEQRIKLFLSEVKPIPNTKTMLKVIGIVIGPILLMIILQNIHHS